MPKAWSLSPRQWQAVNLIRDGKSVDESARDSGLTPEQVGTAWRKFLKQQIILRDQEPEMHVEGVRTRLDRLMEIYYPAAIAGDPQAAHVVLAVLREVRATCGITRPQDADSTHLSLEVLEAACRKVLEDVADGEEAVLKYERA